MKLSTRDIILIGLFAALMAVGAFLKIPNPINPLVPITFQLFFCLYAGLLLGRLKGGMSQVIYMLIGLVGIPVFTGGGGFQYVLDPKFGFIIGFVICGFMVGDLVERMAKLSYGRIFAVSMVGATMIYVIGIAYMWAVMNFYIGSQTGIWVVVGWMAPYMIKDMLLVVIVAVTSRQIIPVLRNRGYLTVDYLQ